MVWGEVSLTHATAHARLAVWEMVSGRYKGDFWIGMTLSIIAGLLTWLAIFEVVSTSFGVGAAPMALIGLMLYENAYVQAGQSVPLA
jgi:Na+-transporting NADH:ubiquinone oxidoreductase subunit NqrE